MTSVPAAENVQTTTGGSAAGRFYFEGAESLRQICSGDEVRLLRLAEERFGVRLVARNNWIDISGAGAAAATTPAAGATAPTTPAAGAATPAAATPSRPATTNQPAAASAAATPAQQGPAANATTN